MPKTPSQASRLLGLDAPRVRREHRRQRLEIEPAHRQDLECNLAEGPREDRAIELDVKAHTGRPAHVGGERGQGSGGGNAGALRVVTDAVHGDIGRGTHAGRLQHGLEAVARQDPVRIHCHRADRQQAVALRIETGRLRIEHDPACIVALRAGAVTREPLAHPACETHG